LITDVQAALINGTRELEKKPREMQKPAART